MKLQTTRLEDRATPTSLPAGFAESVLVTGLTSPTSVTAVSDGRIFVAEQHGEVRVIQDGRLLPDPLLTVKTSASGESGLFGVALDPDFATNGFVYTYYLVPGIDGVPDHNRVSRFTINGNIAVPNSEKVLLEIDPITKPSTSETHNGGAMQFGRDGKLYIATGENVQQTLAQDLNSLRGKILRINADGTIPADNPTRFEGIGGTTTGIDRAIWAVGLRNPYSFDVQPGTGRIFINDVGQDVWEEINQGAAGRNFGWPLAEGASTQVGLTSPIYTYKHGISPFNGLAITAGTFYNPATTLFPANFNGKYFFADFVAGWINTYDATTGQVATFGSDVTRQGVVGLDTTAAGDIIYIARGDGESTGGLYRISYTNKPAIAVQPGSQTVAPGSTVKLGVAASGVGPFTYQWTRGSVDIRGANGATYEFAANRGDDGAVYAVIVKNANGTAVSEGATIHVTLSTPPVPTIQTPSADFRFTAGQTIAFSGSAADADDGKLPATSLTWQVDYFTGDAVRPLLASTSGISTGSFTIPTITPYTRADVFYRITLTAKDSDGQTVSVTRDIKPQTALVTIAASVPGASLTLDGQPVGQINKFTGVAGIERTIVAPDSVTLDGQVLPFIGWYDGVTTASRTLVTPQSDTTYLAVYKRAAATPANIAVGAGAGGGPLIRTYDADGTAKSEAFPFDPSLRTGASVVEADFTGDGVPDLAAGCGPGGAPHVVITDGATGLILCDMLVYEQDFKGGVNVAAVDMSGDGKADLLVTPGNGGGPRVRILNPGTGTTLADYFGIDDINFRGGARAAAGDVNGDGTPDIVVTAGEGGGPRVAGWDGAALMAGQRVRCFADFFAYDPGLRGGAFVSVGNIDGDKFADLVFGAGAGGGPSVVICTGADLMAHPTPTALQTFFSGDPDVRTGIRVAARDLNGDGIAEIITGTGAGGKPVVRVFDSRTGRQTSGFLAFDPDFAGGVYVG